jgi:hypothetical protein
MTIKSSFNSFFVDMMTMKNKRSLIWALCVVAMCVINMKSISFIYLLTFLSLIFLNEEKGIYATYFIPSSKKSAVCGRYIFALILFIAALVINLLSDLVVPIFYTTYIQSSMSFYAIMFIVYLALISVELPFYYWQGYSKVRIFQLPVIIGALVIMVRFIDETTTYSIVTNSNYKLVSFLIIVAILLYICSFFISVKIHEKKDI